MEEPSFFYVQHQLDLWHEQETSLVETQRDVQLRRLHEALTPYINPVTLRRLAAQHEDISHAVHTNHPPEEIQVLLQTLAALLTPHRREHIPFTSRYCWAAHGGDGNT
jgi:hypothetical protein